MKPSLPGTHRPTPMPMKPRPPISRSAPRVAPRTHTRAIARALSAVAALTLGATGSQGGLGLDPGTLTLLPNQAHQTLTLELRNEDPFPNSFGNLDLALEVVDPHRPSALPEELPSITAVNLTLDTVYAGFAPTVDSAAGNTPHLQFWTVTLPNSSPTTPELSGLSRGTLASLTFDTTGIHSGNFQLRLVSTTVGDTALYDGFGQPLLEFAAQNALLLIAVPEPSTITAATAAALGLLALTHRRLRPR